MMPGLSWLLGGMVLMAPEPSTPPKDALAADVINIRELQIDVALGRAGATLSKARRDAFGHLLLMRRNLRSRALHELFQWMRIDFVIDVLSTPAPRRARRWPTL